jgi:hypothetical protein
MPTGTGLPISPYQQLLALVPPTIAGTCTELDPATEIGSLAIASCAPEDVIVDPAVVIEKVVYMSFDSDHQTLNAWSFRWEALGEPDGTDCAVGPSMNVFTVNGQGVGRFVCGPDPSGGLTAWWYDNTHFVVMQVHITEGGYPELANLIQVAQIQPGAITIEELTSYVPSAWQSTCQETPVSAFELGALIAVVCQPTSGGANLAEYVAFDTLANMNAAYQARVDTYAVENSTTTCDSGPDETGYAINGVAAGRIMCAPQVAGIRFDWTDERLNVLSTLTDFESSYSETHQSWLEAGPNLAP